MNETTEPVASLQSTAPMQLEQDLRFLRDAVERRDAPARTSRAIMTYWAIHVAIGYTLIDFAPKYAGLFFLVFGIVGGIFSAWMGARESRESGVRDRKAGRREFLHWSSIWLAIAAAIALGITRHLDGQTIGQMVAMLIGLIYFLAGVHFDRNFIWLGLILMAGSILVSFLPGYGWTCLGLIIATGLLLPTFFQKSAPTEIA